MKEKLSKETIEALKAKNYLPETYYTPSQEQAPPVDSPMPEQTQETPMQTPTEPPMAPAQPVNIPQPVDAQQPVNLQQPEAPMAPAQQIQDPAQQIQDPSQIPTDVDPNQQIDTEQLPEPVADLVSADKVEPKMSLEERAAELGNEIIQSEMAEEQKAAIKQAADIANRKEIVKQALLDEQATTQAVQETVQQNQQREAKKTAQALKTIKEEDQQADIEVEESGIWDSIWSVLKPALFVLGAGIAGGAQTRTGDKGPNRFLEAYNNAMKKITDAKKYKDKQAAALESRTLDKLKVEIQQKAQESTSLYQKAQMHKIYKELDLKKQELDLKRLKAARELAAGAAERSQIVEEIKNKGLSREKFYMLDPKMQKQYAYLPTLDRYQKTPSEAVAKELTLKTVPSYNTGVREINEIKHLMNQATVFEKTKPEMVSKTLSVLNEKLGLLIGKNRVEVIGPGVMTPAELEYIKGLIGNPAKLSDSVTGTESARLNSFLASIQNTGLQKVRAAGLMLPKSKNTMLVESIQKKNPGITRMEAAEQLMKAGKWEDNFSEL